MRANRTRTSVRFNNNPWKIMMQVLRNRLLAAVSVTLVSACATGSMRMVGDTANYKGSACEVTVYQTKDQAVQSGMVKEVCVVEGSSAFSFDHSIEGAIKKNIDKVCQCGVTKAYVGSAHTESQMGMKGVSHVNLIGFK
jgi:hypothetical protein